MLIRVPVSPNVLPSHLRSHWGSQDEHPGHADQSFPDPHTVCLSMPLSQLIFSCHAYPCSCLTEYSPVMLVCAPFSPNTLLSCFRSRWGSQDEHPGRADQSFPDPHAVCRGGAISQERGARPPKQPHLLWCWRGEDHYSGDPILRPPQLSGASAGEALFFLSARCSSLCQFSFCE